MPDRHSVSRSICLLACGIAAGGSGPAIAAPVVVEAVASSNSVYFDPEGLLPFSAAAAANGARIIVTYDSLAPDQHAADPLVGRYALQSMTLTVGGQAIPLFGGSGISVIDKRPATPGASDLWEARSFAATASPNPELPRTVFASLSLVAFLGTASPLSSDALFPPPWPADWNVALIRYAVEEAIPGSAFGTTVATANFVIESVTTTVVPVPATGWLLVTGCCTLLGWTGRRRPQRVQLSSLPRRP